MSEGNLKIISLKYAGIPVWTLVFLASEAVKTSIWHLSNQKIRRKESTTPAGVAQLSWYRFFINMSSRWDES